MRADLLAIAARMPGVNAHFLDAAAVKHRWPTPEEWARRVVDYANALQAELERRGKERKVGPLDEEGCEGETPERIEQVAARHQAFGALGSAAHLRGYAAGIREGLRRAAARRDEARAEVAESEDDATLEMRVAELRKRFAAYDGGDRPMSPPAELMRELLDAEDALAEARSARESSAGPSGRSAPPGRHRARDGSCGA